MALLSSNNDRTLSEDTFTSFIKYEQIAYIEIIITIIKELYEMNSFSV